MDATEHSNQERLNPQRVRNSIIGFVLSPKALSSILVNRLKHQVLAAQTNEPPPRSPSKSARICTSQLFAFAQAD